MAAGEGGSAAISSRPVPSLVAAAGESIPRAAAPPAPAVEAGRSDEELEAFDRSIDVHVSRIRAAIEDDPRHPRRLLTIRGAGYVFARQQD